MLNKSTAVFFFLCSQQVKKKKKAEEHFFFVAIDKQTKTTNRTRQKCILASLDTWQYFQAVTC